MELNTDYNTEKNLDAYIGLLINLTALRLKSMLSQGFKSHNVDITPKQWHVLFRLWQEGGLYQKQIADQILRDKPNITRLLDVLEDKKLIYKQTDSNDRRISKLFLTKKGEEVVKELNLFVDELSNKGFKDFNNEEKENFYNLLTKVYKNLDKKK